MHQENLDALIKNLHEINLVLKAYSLTLPEYLALTGGAPTEPLALPANHMDKAEYNETAARLRRRLEAARECKDRHAITEALRARYQHLFCMRPMDVGQFRARLGALIEERCDLMEHAKTILS